MRAASDTVHGLLAELGAVRWMCRGWPELAVELEGGGVWLLGFSCRHWLQVAGTGGASFLVIPRPFAELICGFVFVFVAANV